MTIFKEAFSTVANWISMSRMVVLIPLWIWAVQGRYTWVAWGLIYAALSDTLDGTVARIFNQCSEIGETIDSWADGFIIVSVVIWMFLYFRDLFPADRLMWLIPGIVLFLTYIIISLIKTRGIDGHHILEGKILGVFGYLGIVLALFGAYSEWVYICMIGAWILNSLVNIIYTFRPDLFNKHQRSLILGLLGLDFEEGPIRYLFS